MSNFLALEEIKGVVSNTFTFGQINLGTKNQVTCSDGKTASWELVEILNSDNSISYCIQIYDSSEGEDVALGLINSVPGADLLGGLFSTGVIPDRDVTDTSCIFYRVDY